jgi:hypothetical protein
MSFNRKLEKLFYLSCGMSCPVLPCPAGQGLAMKDRTENLVLCSSLAGIISLERSKISLMLVLQTIFRTHRAPLIEIIPSQYQIRLLAVMLRAIYVVVMFN